MVGIRVAVVVGVVVLAAGCGSDDDARVRRLCARVERYEATEDGELDAAEILAEERVQARIAPYDIADELALVSASHQAAVEGTGPIIPPSRLAAAEAEVDRWVETHCGPGAAG